MDSIENMRAFLAIARLGSFTAAADKLDLVASVVTKRVSQLEASLGAQLLLRSTRKVSLTPEGEHHLPRIAATVKAYDETLAAVRRGIAQLEGPIRIKVPTAFGALRLNKILHQFVKQHPGLELEVLLLDGPFNPIVEKVDIAITAFPSSFDGVADEFLWTIKRVLVASPGYLADQETLTHPRQLERHTCIAYQPTGRGWSFLSATGLVTVNIHAKVSSNDMAMLLDAAREGEGIALLSRWIAEDHLKAGELQIVLPDYPVPDLWVKAMVPTDRLAIPRIAALLRYLKAHRLVGGSLIEEA